MKKWVFTILFGSALVLGACGGDDATNNDAGDNNGNAVEVADAESAYKNSCAGCHGDDLTGASGPDLTEIGSKYSADEIEDIIENGVGGMPAMPSVSEGDRTEIADWLASKE